MRKILFLITVFVLGLNIKAQTPCSITTSPVTTAINCGQTVQLSASPTGGNIALTNNFNLGGAGAGWSTTAGAQFDNPCGASPTNSTYLWMGSVNAAPRTLQTNGLNVNCGGSICFDLRFAVQGGATPCEGPDTATEGVYLQYSTNGGVTWTTIFYFDPNINGTAGNATSPYTNWANYCFPIPAGAISTNTIFRWAQLTTSANVNDHWGLDNIVITGTCSTPHYFSWIPASGLSSSSISNPVASPTSSTTYTVYFTDGISDSCSATIDVTVNLPTVDAGLTQSICLGQTANLIGTSSAFNSAPVTFNSTGTASISDLTTSTLPITVSGLNLANVTTNSIQKVCLDITHTWDSDLDIYLQCPGGTQILLSDDNGGAGDNYTGTCFTVNATNVIGTVGNNTAPFTGSFAPEAPGGFAGLNGCAANGVWTLVVYDDAGGDIGTINNWSIIFNDNVNPTINWAPNLTMVGDTTYNPSVTPISTTTYTLSVSNYPGCVSSDTVSVLVNFLPNATAGFDSTICTGDSTIMNASGGTNYLWSPSNGLSATNIANPVATPTVTTEYIVIVSNGTCAGRDTVIVNVNNTPNVDAGNNVTICDGLTVQLLATGATTFNWATTSSLNSLTIANPVANPNDSTTYYVVGTDANGCQKLDSVSVFVNPTPVANAGIDDTICSGSSITLNGQGLGNYSWTPGIGLNNTAIANPVASPTLTTTYVLTVTNSFNCVDKDTFLLSVNPLPNVDAGTNQAVCSGSSVQLNATGATSYTWSPATTLNNSSIPNPVATPTANTTYIVTGTDANGCVKSDAVSIVLLPPVPVNASNNTSICAGGSVNLSVTAPTSNIVWSPPVGLSSTTAANTTASPNQTTTYTVTVTQGLCTGKDSVTVTVNQLPNASAGLDVGICQGGTGQLNASGGNSYSWSPSGGLSSNTIANPIVSTPINISYTLTVTDLNGCTDKDTVNVTVNALPIIDAGNTAFACFGSSVQLNATGGLTYSWQPATNLSNTTVANPFASPSSNTTFTVTGTDANGCSNIDSVLVNVNNQISINVTGNNTICQGLSSTLTVNGSSGTYSWTPSNGLSQTSGSTVTASPATSTTYSVVVTDVNGCTGSATFNLSVNSLPNVSAGNNVGVCIGSSVLLQGNGAVNYFWTPSTGLSSVTSPSPLASPTTNQVYTLAGTDANGCVNTATVLVTVNPLPIINSTSVDTASCGSANGSITVTNVSGGSPGYTYSVNSGPVQSSPVLTNLSQGTYTINTIDANGCVDQEIVSVPSQIDVVADFTFNPNGGIYPIDVLFDNNSIGFTNSVWSFGNGNNSTSNNPNNAYLAPGTYTITLIVYNNFPQCSDTVSQTIEILDIPSLELPNIFSPNGDGVNDFVQLKGQGIKSYEAKVYNRWGRKVGEWSGDINAQWSGADNQPGTYYIVVEAVLIDDSTKTLSGFIQLMK